MGLYKSNIGDFPLKVYPCKWWWVRYAVACTRKSELYEEETEEIFEKAGIRLHSYRGDYSSLEITLNGEKMKIDENHPVWKFIVDREKGSPQWDDCPYEEGDQSECPNYIPSDWYKDKSLEELRKIKGYEL